MEFKTFINKLQNTVAIMTNNIHLDTIKELKSSIED